MNNLAQASQVLNRYAPEGERLAYLNPTEEAILKAYGGSGHEHIAGTGIPTYGFLGDLWNKTLGNDGLGGMLTGRKARKAAEAQQQAQQQAYDEATAEQERLLNESNNAGLASNLVSKGKLGMLDFNDPDAVSAGLKTLEGQFLDPFPEYTRPAGDAILGGINETADVFGEVAGSARDRMEGMQPTMSKLSGMNQSSIDRLGEIYDGRMQSKLEGFNAQSDDVANRLKQLNLDLADSTSQLQQNVLGRANAYADSLGSSIDTKVDLTNRQFNELNQVPNLMKGLNREQMERFQGTMGAQLGRNEELTNRFGDTFGSRNEAADRIRDAELLAADRILNAERAKALAAGSAAENLANAKQRAMRSSMVGQGTGTDLNMGNAMIRAQLGQERSDLLADALIRDAERRALTDVNYANRTGDALIDQSRKLESVLDNDATIGYMTKMEDVLDSNADIEGARINSDRFKSIAEINPAMADVYRNEALLGNANTALGFGDPTLGAVAQNLGIDQGMIDSDQGIYNSIMAQQLANTGMIPGLGMQEAMLPGLYAEAGLAPQGAISRNVSPFTATGSLPPGQSNFTSKPFTPTPIPEGGDWLDTLAKIPAGIDKAKDAFGKIQGIFGQS